jgi:anti-sigma B factor antagonist
MQAARLRDDKRLNPLKSSAALKSLQEENIMTVNFNQRDRDGVTIIDVSGRITLGSGNQELRDRVNNALEEGKKNIVLNLADLSYVDSSGVGTLVGCYTSAQNRGASLKLLNLTKKIVDLLTITKLLTVFETFDNEEQAVNSFK